MWLEAARGVGRILGVPLRCHPLRDLRPVVDLEPPLDTLDAVDDVPVDEAKSCRDGAVIEPVRDLCYGGAHGGKGRDSPGAAVRSERQFPYLVVGTRASSVLAASDR